MAFAELQKIVVVSAHCTSRDAAAYILKRLHRRQLLRKKPRLYLPGNLHFAVYTAIRLHPLRHLFGKTYILKSDSRLARHRIEQMLVFAGVRLFRKSLAKHQQADQPAIAPKDRHQAFRRKRPQIAGRLVSLRDVPGFPALRDLAEQWQRGWDCVRLSGNEAYAKAERELRPRQRGRNCV